MWSTNPFICRCDIKVVSRQSGLISREEALLHLQASRDMPEGIEGPYNATREGISKSLGIRPNHLSRELNHLIRSGDVVSRLAHVLGFRKRVKVYRLSAVGMKRAETLIDSIKGVPIIVRDEFGNDEVVTLDAAYKKLGGRRGHVEILRASKLEIASESKDNLRSFAESGGFIGRKDEMRALSEWLGSSGSSVLVVYGIAGIGKTSLVSRFAGDLQDRKKVYYRVREWDSPRGLLQALGNAFAGMGDERLQALLRTREGDDMTNVSLALIDALGPLEPLVILDDIWTASKDAWKAIALLCDGVAGSRAKLMLISREFPSGFEGGPEARGFVTRLRVDGLKDEESRLLLTSHGVPKGVGSVDDVVHTLRGHPLLLKMVRGAGDIQPLFEGDVARFIYGEIYSRLSKDERALLGTLAVLRYPIPVLVLSRKMGFIALESLQRKSLTERVGGNVALHDIMRSFVLAYMSENEGRECHRLAREMLEPYGRNGIERAYHAINAGEAACAMRELLSNGEALIESGHAQDLLVLLDTVPMQALAPGVARDAVVLRMKALEFIGRYGEVISNYERAGPEIGADPKAMLKAAESYLEIGRTEKASELYALLKRKRLDDESHVVVERGLGRIDTLLGRYDLARRHVAKAIELARRAGLDDMRGQCLMDLGSIGLFCERMQEANRYFLEAMRLVRRDDNSLARLYSNLSIVHFNRSMYQMALEMLERSETIFNRSGSYIGSLKCMLNKSAIYYRQGKYRDTEATLLRAEEMARRAGIRYLQVGALVNLSSTYNALGKHELSRSNAEEALRIATELGDERGAIAAKNNLSFSIIKLGDPGKAIRMLGANLKRSERIGTHGLSADALEMMSEGYEAMGRRGTALTHAVRALDLARKRGIANVVKNLEVRVNRLRGLAGAKGRRRRA